MAVDQIQIKWKDGNGKSYQDSFDALKHYQEPPSIKGSVILKGNYTQVAIDQVVATAQMLTLDAKMAFDLSYADADSTPRYVGAINLKAELYTKDIIDQLIELGKELGLEPQLVLTATWGNNQDVQIRLFPPSAHRAAPGRRGAADDFDEEWSQKDDAEGQPALLEG